MSSSVVAGRDGAEALLTSRVPLRSQSRHSKSTQAHTRVYQHLSLHSLLPTHNLKFYGLPIQLDGPDLEVNTNRADVALCRCHPVRNKYMQVWVVDMVPEELPVITALIGNMRNVVNC